MLSNFIKGGGEGGGERCVACFSKIKCSSEQAQKTERSEERVPAGSGSVVFQLVRWWHF